MKHKYREDYWTNVPDCLNYADVYLDDSEHIEVMKSYKMYSIIDLFLTAVTPISIITLGAWLAFILDETPSSMNDIIQKLPNTLAVAISCFILVNVVTFILSRLLENTVGRRWFQYYMTWYDIKEQNV